jgi:zinc protease
LRRFHTRYYQPANCILAVVGDISTPEAFARAAHFFSAWKNLAPPLLPLAATPPRREERQAVAIDKPDAVQTEIRIGSLGVPRSSPDYLALSVANEILGGPSENRLFKALRSRQGLTYGASSDLVCRRDLGAWVAKTFTRTPETVKSVHIALEQIRSLREHEISRSELETAQSYLVGHLALDFETSEDVASQILELIQNNLPLDYWNRYPDQLMALTTGDVWNATQRYLDPDHDIIVLVGNVADFKKDLKKLGHAQVIPLNEMDFASPDLRRPPGEAGK